MPWYPSGMDVDSRSRGQNVRTHGVLSIATAPNGYRPSRQNEGDEETFERALQVFSSKGIEWLTTTTLPERYQSIRTTERYGTERNETRQDGTEQDENKNPSKPSGNQRSGSRRTDRLGPRAFEWIFPRRFSPTRRGSHNGPSMRPVARTDGLPRRRPTEANVVATAARRSGRPEFDPVGLFKWIVRGRRWNTSGSRTANRGNDPRPRSRPKGTGVDFRVRRRSGFETPRGRRISTEQRRADLRKQIEAAANVRI